VTLLSRRGFTRAALAAGASFALPRLGQADVVDVRATFRALETPRLGVALLLASADGASVPADALILRGTLDANGVHQVELASDHMRYMRRSRAGYRLGRPVELTADPREYGRYFGEWPEGASTGVLRVEVALHPRASRAAETFQAIVGARETLRVTRGEA